MIRFDIIYYSFCLHSLFIVCFFRVLYGGCRKTNAEQRKNDGWIDEDRRVKCRWWWINLNADLTKCIQFPNRIDCLMLPISVVDVFISFISSMMIYVRGFGLFSSFFSPCNIREYASPTGMWQSQVHFPQTLLELWFTLLNWQCFVFLKACICKKSNGFGKFVQLKFIILVCFLCFLLIMSWWTKNAKKPYHVPSSQLEFFNITSSSGGYVESIQRDSGRELGFYDVGLESFCCEDCGLGLGPGKLL